MMNDWATGVETRNYRILRRSDRHSLMDLLANIMCILMIAGALVGYLWINIRIDRMGYEVERLKEADKSLLRVRNSLILDEETLKQPQWIDMIARTSLAMEMLQPNQRISGFRSINPEYRDILAMASDGKASAPPRRSSAYD